MFAIVDLKNSTIRDDIKGNTARSVVKKMARIEFEREDDDTVKEETVISVINKNCGSIRQYKVTREKYDKPRYVSQENPNVYYTYETGHKINLSKIKNIKTEDEQRWFMYNGNKMYIDDDNHEIIITKYTIQNQSKTRGRPRKDADVTNIYEPISSERVYDLIPKKTFKTIYKYIIVPNKIDDQNK